MKIIFTLLILSAGQIFGQSQQLLSLTLGTAHAIKELWEVNPKVSIVVMNIDDNTQFTKNGIIMSDAKKSWGTVIAVMPTQNKYYIASFAPLLNGKNFNGQGEFYLYENNNGKVIQLEHFIGSIRPSTGEANLEYFDNPSKTFVVSISEKLEVQFFMFKGYMWGLPNNYYNYDVK
jgi:hypothetical protein